MIRDSIIKMIEAFLEIYPDAEFRAGHIVLSDYNLSDHNINFCLKGLRDGGYPASGVHQAFTYSQSPADRLCDKVTIAFLRCLLLIPEQDRDSEEDLFFDYSTQNHNTVDIRVYLQDMQKHILRRAEEGLQPTPKGKMLYDSDK